jgi:hypothetical protein
MPRRTRVHINGLPLHIVQRGHDRAACFFEGQDRLAWLGRLGKRKSADDSAASLIHACMASRVWSVSSNRTGSRVLCWTTLARATRWLP